MSEQVDIAEDLGVVPPALPEIQFLGEFLKAPLYAPPILIEGMLHQGCKLVLGGSSKTNKSWCLLDLGLSVASGSMWWGRRCSRAAVVYVNFELHDWALKQRVQALQAARPECVDIEDTLAVWNLRGRNADLTLLRPKLEEKLMRHEFGMIILDPAYKVLGDRDENANGEIAGLMNEFEALARSSGAAIVLAHHFAKGDAAAKAAIDRMSGAGAWARDPDALLIMSRHEEEDCYTVTPILRNVAAVPEFVLAWDYPLMRVARDLNPEALRRQAGRRKVCTDKEFLDAVLVGQSAGNQATMVMRAANVLDVKMTTAKRYLARLVDCGLVCHEGGLYWAAHQEVTTE